MRLQCWQAKLLLERRGAGIAEPERLLLEQHLADCDACAGEANALEALLRVIGDGFELSPQRRTRALAGALEGRRLPTAAARPKPASRALVLAAAAAALLVAFSLRAHWSPKVASLQAPPRLVFDASAVGDRVTTGDVRRGDLRLAAGTALAAPTVLSSETGGEVRLAHALVRLEPESRMRWNAQTATVLLERGGVHVEVDPRPKRPFVLETPRFRVEVIGTVFEVTLGTVRVIRGRVRVYQTDALRAELTPGQTWNMETEPTHEAAADASSRRPNVGALLAHARARLAAGDVPAARKDLALALAAKPSAAQDAEARSLLAECALVSGDSAEAQRGYAAVAREHAGTAAAETALFAEARLERNRAHQAALLKSYLAKYPDGRFSAEAKSRLADLEK